MWCTRQEYSALPAPRPEGPSSQAKTFKNAPGVFVSHSIPGVRLLRRPAKAVQKRSRRFCGASAGLTRYIHVPRPVGRRFAPSQTAVLPFGRIRSDSADCTNKKPPYGGFLMFGAPDRSRTCDLCLRRAALYPAELRVRNGGHFMGLCGYCPASIWPNSVAGV